MVRIIYYCSLCIKFKIRLYGPVVFVKKIDCRPQLTFCVQKSCSSSLVQPLNSSTEYFPLRKKNISQTSPLIYKY